jgi:hypothetical protein
MFDTAAFRASEIQRPLAVIGNVSDVRPPQVRVFSPENPESIDAKDNSCVVLCSFSLERVDDIDRTWREVMRVAGSPFNVFVAHHRGGIASWSPSIRYNIELAPPMAPGLKYKPRFMMYPREE